MRVWKFCPEGHKWEAVSNTGLYSDYYYCPECNEIYIPTVEKITKEEVNKQFSSDRYSAMIEYANVLKATDLVTPDDLRKLGYLMNNLKP